MAATTPPGPERKLINVPMPEMSFPPASITFPMPDTARLPITTNSSVSNITFFTPGSRLLNQSIRPAIFSPMSPIIPASIGSVTSINVFSFPFKYVASVSFHNRLSASPIFFSASSMSFLALRNELRNLPARL